MSSDPKSKPGQPLSKADKTAEAQDIVAAFLAKGGRIKQMPAVVPTPFACSNCGHTGISGVTPGKVRRCPKCREPLK
jgi:predicted Zn-ribbon and HTH transcriptional regulator